MHPLLETSVMTETVRMFGSPPNYWFLQNLFKSETTATYRAEWYLRRLTRNVAPLQSRGREGTMRAGEVFEYHDATYLHTRPKDLVLNVDAQTLRKPGSSDTTEAYGRQLVLDRTEHLRRQVDRTMEWVGAQMLQATSQNLTIDGAVISVASGISTTHCPTAVGTWATSNYDIISDIVTNKALIVQDSGEVPDFMLMTEQVHGYLINNSEIQEYIRESSDVNSVILEGRMKRLMGLDIVIYEERYTTDAGTITRMWPNEYVLFGCLPAKSQTKMLIGPSEDTGAVGATPGIFSKTWELPDPPGVHILLDANFYPVVGVPDAFVFLCVQP